MKSQGERVKEWMMEDAVSESRRQDAWERYKLAREAAHEAAERVLMASDAHLQAMEDTRLAWGAYLETKAP